VSVDDIGSFFVRWYMISELFSWILWEFMGNV